MLTGCCRVGRAGSCSCASCSGWIAGAWVGSWGPAGVHERGPALCACLRVCRTCCACSLCAGGVPCCACSGSGVSVVGWDGGSVCAPPRLFRVLGAGTGVAACVCVAPCDPAERRVATIVMFRRTCKSKQAQEGGRAEEKVGVAETEAAKSGSLAAGPLHTSCLTHRLAACEW